MKLFLRHGIAIAALAFLPALTHTSANLLAQDHVDSGRKIVVRVAPQYPSMARSMNIQGSVKADVLVAPNGSMKSVEIKGGHPLFVQSVENALREWKWEPAAHETHEIVELKFTL
jgi:TonB family protein